LFLAHSFGLPVIATNVGSLADDIVAGENGLICEPESPDDLATKLDDYFHSRLYKELESRRMRIREDANRRHSWEIVGQRTLDAYAHATGASAKQDLESAASSIYALEGKLASTDERKR
jgi:glycosyltransferase involved in cell wall biosynthesis